MAGFVAVANDNVYHSFKNGEDEKNIGNGLFVTVDYETNEASLYTAEPVGDDEEAEVVDVYFTDSENDTVFCEGVDDIDFAVKPNGLLRAKKLQVGEVIVTTNFEGDIDSYKVGAPVTLASDGYVASGAGDFVVNALTTAYGTDAVSLQKIK